MGDRLTPEREAEIRQPRTRRLDWAPQVYEEWDDERADLLAELDAERAARQAAERQICRLVYGEEIESDRLCSHELEAIPLRDRVRELEAERDEISGLLAKARAERDESRSSERAALVRINAAWADAYTAIRAREPLATGRVEDLPTVYGPGPTVQPTVYGYGDAIEARRMELREMESWRVAREKAERETATLRAHLATLREAVESLLSKTLVRAVYRGALYSLVDPANPTEVYDMRAMVDALRAALSTAPTLASIEAWALRREAEREAGDTAGSGYLVDLLRARADELEGKR